MFLAKETEEVKACRQSKNVTLVYFTILKHILVNQIPACYTLILDAPGMRDSQAPVQVPTWLAA